MQWAGCLDFFDGIAARKLNQMSKFGEILDVVLDNFSRSALWVGALIHSQDTHFLIVLAALYFPMEEWFTFLCTQLMTIQRNDKHWKSVHEKNSIPKWASIVFANGFKNIYGVFVVGSSWVLPFCYTAYHIGYDQWWVSMIIAIALPSRLYNSAICLYFQSKYMLNVDVTKSMHDE